MKTRHRNSTSSWIMRSGTPPPRRRSTWPRSSPLQQGPDGVERPGGLSPTELEQYELAIEEQAYPFEEKAIQVHESNLKLMSRGVSNVWIEKSLQKLAKSVPARV